MCFFDQHRFLCGDWKWGRFQQHCAKEYRIGETCGMKLIMQTIEVSHKCKLCEKIDTKMRRRAVEVQRIGRWQQEPHKFAKSIEKSVEIIRTLDGEMYELRCENNRQLQQIGDSSTWELHKQIAKLGADGEDPGHGNRLAISPTKCAYERFELKKKKDVFLGLPMTFDTANGPATVMAVPDSGSDHNVMSFDLALHLGFGMLQIRGQDRQFSLIDGGTVTSRGTVSSYCRFGKTFENERTPFFCVFQVLDSVISPLIMSASFLERTETMTKYRQRLVAQSLWPRLPRICALGQTQRRLHCTIQGYNVQALVDTGSDIDVLSHSFVVQKSWEMKKTDEIVVLADGRRIEAIGICVLQLSAGKDAKMVPLPSTDGFFDDPRHLLKESQALDGQNIRKRESPIVNAKEARVRRVIESTFYVLDGILVDALVGAASIESLKIFSQEEENLFPKREVFNQLSGLHRIGLAQRAKRCASKLIGESLSSSEARHLDTLREQLNQADQRENARREAADARSVVLTGEDKVEFDEKENTQRNEYDEYRAHLMRALSLDA